MLKEKTKTIKFKTEKFIVKAVNDEDKVVSVEYTDKNIANIYVAEHKKEFKKIWIERVVEDKEVLLSYAELEEILESKKMAFMNME